MSIVVIKLKSLACLGPFESIIVLNNLMKFISIGFRIVKHSQILTSSGIHFLKDKLIDFRPFHYTNFYNL